MSLAISVGLLVAGATFLVLSRGMVRLVLGFVVLSHAANLALFAAGGESRREQPIGETLDPATTADALPQAFVLTAIVIAFAITVFMLVLAVVGGRDDDTDDDTGDDPDDPDDPTATAPDDGSDGSTDGDGSTGGARSRVAAGDGGTR